MPEWPRPGANDTGPWGLKMRYFSSAAAEALSILAENRGRAVRYGARRAAAALAPVLREQRAKGGIQLPELAAAWREIVGPELATLCAPEKLTGEKGARTLHLAAAGPAALVLQHQSARLLERINLFAGTGSIAKIAFAQKSLRQIAGNAPKPALANPAINAAERARLSALLATVDNPVLREALDRLGQAVLSAPGGQARG